MKIVYRVWTDSNHKIVYTLGYFSTKELAEKYLEFFNKDRIITTVSRSCGINEVIVHEPDDVIPIQVNL